MTIDDHIGVIEDLKSTMSVCMPEPEKTEICTSLNEAISTMRKYQKIQEIINTEVDPNICNNFGDVCKVQAIREVIEDGEDNNQEGATDDQD